MLVACFVTQSWHLSLQPNMPASDVAGDGEGHPEGEEGAGDVEGAGGGDEAKVDQRTKCHN